MLLTGPVTFASWIDAGKRVNIKAYSQWFSSICGIYVERRWKKTVDRATRRYMKRKKKKNDETGIKGSCNYISHVIII